MFLLSLPMRRALGMAFVGAGASVLALGTAGIASAASPAAGAREPVTFVVNSIGDEPDVTRDGTCLTALKKCTLRAALTEANAAGDRAIINFGMPGTGARVLEIGSALPALTNPAGIVIDGYSQPGTLRNTSPTASNALLKVELKGKGPGTFDGLEILSPNNVVTGISLYNFTNQISIRGNKADNNRIVGSYVCTNAAGTVGSAPMGIQIGIMLQKGASGNVISA
jgi:CSLREA domain-containing protein